MTRNNGSRRRPWSRMTAIAAIIILATITAMTSVSIFPGPVSAADPPTVDLVSNVSRSTNTNKSFTSLAISFRTGSHPDGYEPKEMRFRLAALAAGDDFTIDVRTSVTQTDAGTVSFTFTKPDPLPTGTGETGVALAPPDGVVLQPSTTYFIVLTKTAGSFTVPYTSSDTQNGLAGWGIGNKTIRGQVGNWSNEDQGVPKFALKGFAIRSADATLSGLEVLSASDNTEQTLDPAFDTDTTEYQIQADADIDQVTVTPAKGVNTSTFVFQDGGGTEIPDASTGAGHQVNLEPGNNTVRVVVTAEDEETTKTYTLTIVRAVPRTSAINADGEAPTSWLLLPDGLNIGDQFRLLFISHGDRDGTSSNIADYNTFIQNSAAAGHPAIGPISAGFTAVACTATVDARDNTGTTGQGVPIYWLGGNKVADNYPDFYDGAWDDEENAQQEDGEAINILPQTGCANNGTGKITGGQSFALGESIVAIGQLDSDTTGQDPLDGGTAGNSNSLSLYGTSQVLTVVNAPATGVPTITGDGFVGFTLTADTSGIEDNDGLTNVSYSYQWIRQVGTVQQDIAGATGSTYTLTADDEGNNILVRVDFQDDLGDQESLTSDKFPEDETVLSGPELVQVAYRPSRVELYYDEPLNKSDPPTSAFQISVNGAAAVNPASTETPFVFGDDPKVVFLYPANPFNPGDTITVSYSVPTTNPLAGTVPDLHLAAPFTSLTADDITGAWNRLILVEMSQDAHQSTEPLIGQTPVTVGVVIRLNPGDLAIPPDLRFWVEIMTKDGTAKANEDYVPLINHRLELTAANTEGNPVNTVVMVKSDGIMEGKSETFGVGLNGRFDSESAPHARLNTALSRVSITDSNKSSLEIIATPDRIIEGQTTEITLEIRATDDDGSHSDECQIGIPISPVNTSRQGTATQTDDYTITVIEGSEDNHALEACGNATFKIRLVAKSDANDEFEETLEFKPDLPFAVDDRVQRNLLRSAVITIADPLTEAACDHPRIIFCSTMTTGDLDPGPGYINAPPEFIGTMTQVGDKRPHADRFQYESQEYRLESLNLGQYPPSSVELVINPADHQILRPALKLHVGNDAYSLGRADFWVGNDIYKWHNQGGRGYIGGDVLVAISRSENDVTPPKIIEAYIPPDGDRVILEFGEKLDRTAGTLSTTIRDAFKVCLVDNCPSPNGSTEGTFLPLASAEVITATTLMGSLDSPCEDETPLHNQRVRLRRDQGHAADI